MTKPARYRHATHVSWRRVDTEAVILNVDTSEYYSLDNTAADIWERLGRGKSLAATVSEVAALYGERSERVEKDARAFLADLLAERLLETIAL
ncbi:MAG TPA: hypothetical protein DCZ01_12610 [Elusimicrobia bacterium]|nr:MAG: hypothetical protein A2X37_04850 [Elusimicrobia bacterium GWA2_66_18]OGR71921.1 MAG: hypothetical protein A2X40_01575 [Elusimicrobia bacterium GWC2_65_9]HAZ09329.1 hypothetical protein [Elusimicrobiota bacterium]